MVGSKPIKNVQSASNLVGIFPFEVGYDNVNEFLPTGPRMVPCHTDKLTRLCVRTICLDVLNSDVYQLIP
jgi:hypothetical protein